MTIAQTSLGSHERNRTNKVNELHLFAGAGGGILGGMLLGHTCVCAVEIEPYPRKVLLQRQLDGILPKFPIWDDIRTFDGKPWRGHVDIVCGGFPCQDISAANLKAVGITGKRSGLWSHMARIIGEVRPRFVLVENSPLLVGRGLAVVLGDLARMGYDARWGVVGAHHAGAPHMRNRVWILAHTQCLNGTGAENMESGKAATLIASGQQSRPDAAWLDALRGQWDTEPDVGRVADGVAARVDRLRAIGNGQVPAVAALAFKMLSV